MTRLIRLVRIMGEAWLRKKLILAQPSLSHNPHQPDEDYGRGLVEEEVDSCLVWMKSEPPEREHFLEERRGGSEIDRLSEAMFRCRQRAKGVKDFFSFDIPPGGVEK